MWIVLSILAAVILLKKNTTNPNPAKSTSSNASTPTLVTSAPDWYKTTGTDITDNPPTTSTNLVPPVIAKPPAGNFTLGNVNWNNPNSLPEIQLAKYQSDQADIAPTPPPNVRLEHLVPAIATEVYKSSLVPNTITPRWLE